MLSYKKVFRTERRMETINVISSDICYRNVIHKYRYVFMAETEDAGMQLLNVADTRK